MKQRYVRFLPIVKSTDSPGQTNGEAEVVEMAVVADKLGSGSEQFVKPVELTNWDWTVFLLHTAAEVEHALMVQYLYAGYSLKEVVASGTGGPDDADFLVSRWRKEIFQVAREEMGHLITVQNLLRFIGGPLNFDREDFPFRNLLYPFPFHLEPLTKKSLAKYVMAEMPEKPNQPLELLSEIKNQFDAPVNRVGTLYNELIKLFKDDTLLLERDFHPETAQHFQAKAKDWSMSYRPLICSISSRDEAIFALEAIATEGEGSLESNSTDQQKSHFQRFLGIYKNFPKENSQWATEPVPTNPNTLPDGTPMTREQKKSRISDPLTCLWANLFNIRYRMLLLDLRHSLSVKRTEQTNLCSRIRSWAFFEMRGRAAESEQSKGGLRGIAQKLTTLPLKEGTTSAQGVGAPPFELPYTLYPPDEAQDWWHLHLALIDASAEVIEKIKQVKPKEKIDPILADLTAFDQEAKTVIKQALNQETRRGVKRPLKKPNINLARMKGNIGFEEDIKPLFEPYVLSMKKKQLNLADWWECRDRALDIQHSLVSRVMPPGEAWPQLWIDRFNDWILEGCPKYKSREYSTFFRALDAATEYSEEYKQASHMGEAITILANLLPAWREYAAVSNTDERKHARKQLEELLKKQQEREAVSLIDGLLINLAQQHFSLNASKSFESATLIDAFEYFGKDRLPIDVERANLAKHDSELHPPDAPLYHRLDRPGMWFNWAGQLELGWMASTRDHDKDTIRTALMAGLTLGCAMDFLYRDYIGAAQPIPRTKPSYQPDQSTTNILRLKARRLSSQWKAAVQEMHELYRIFRYQ